MQLLIDQDKIWDILCEMYQFQPVCPLDILTHYIFYHLSNTFIKRNSSNNKNNQSAASLCEKNIGEWWWELMKLIQGWSKYAGNTSVQHFSRKKVMSDHTIVYHWKVKSGSTSNTRMKLRWPCDHKNCTSRRISILVCKLAFEYHLSTGYCGYMLSLTVHS